MSYVDPQTVEKAREMDLLTYLQNYEPNELVRLSDGTYCTRTHDSLKISNRKWMWWSRGFGGYSALDYLIKVKGLDFVQAVETIVGKCAVTQNINLQQKEIKQPKPLLLPDKSTSNRVIFKYLCGREAATALINKLKNDYKVVDLPPPRGKDFNDFLCLQLNISKQKSKERNYER